MSVAVKENSFFVRILACDKFSSWVGAQLTHLRGNRTTTTNTTTIIIITIIIIIIIIISSSSSMFTLSLVQKLNPYLSCYVDKESHLLLSLYLRVTERLR